MKKARLNNPAIGRPTLGKAKVTLSMLPEQHEEAIQLAKSRGMALGTLFSELVRAEVKREASGDR